MVVGVRGAVEVACGLAEGSSRVKDGFLMFASDTWTVGVMGE
jgi:hypothetical protein